MERLVESLSSEHSSGIEEASDEATLVTRP